MTLESIVDQTTQTRRRDALPFFGGVLRKAFSEHISGMRDVQQRCRRYLHSPAGTPAAYTVAPDRISPATFKLRRNLFSMLFSAVYHVLDIPRERRFLYVQLNYLFRIWVTSTDNLLDAEDEVVIPVRMQGQSRTMRQVVTLMAADRVLHELLAEAVRSNTIDAGAADRLSEQTLRCLLPSAAQEAGEEGGITSPRPLPEFVLGTVHRYKTGILFHVPFVGPDVVETSIDRHLLEQIQEALMNFGLGCQLLDDIRDVARDWIEQRHNYVLSLIEHQHPELLVRLRESVKTVEDRAYLVLPGPCAETAQRALGLMTDALTLLGRCGFGFAPRTARRMATSMLNVLDLGDLRYATS